MSRKKDRRQILPKKIRIGIDDYDLIHMDQEEADAIEAIGACNVLDLWMKVLATLPDSRFAETLEHEINHGCWAAAKLEDAADEETVINRLTPVQIAARRDNPEIYAWIDRAIAKKV